jgi:hypothetical protein
MGGQVLEQPLLAQGSGLGQPVVGFVHRGVQRTPMQESFQVVKQDHVGWDQGALDADVFWVGQ